MVHASGFNILIGVVIVVRNRVAGVGIQDVVVGVDKFVATGVGELVFEGNIDSLPAVDHGGKDDVVSISAGEKASVQESTVIDGVGIAGG